MKLTRIVVFTLVLVVLLVGVYQVVYPNEKTMAIFYDDNLISQQDSYTNCPSFQKKDNTYTATIKDFTGTRTICTMPLKENTTLNISIQASKKSGDFKIVLISSDGSVETIWSDQTKQDTMLVNKKIYADGDYSLKAVGIHTNAAISLAVDTKQEYSN